MTEKLIEQLAEILECPVSDIKPETTFRLLSNWDSLSYMSVIAMIDAECGVVIPQGEFRQLATVADIVSYVARHKAG